MSAAPTRDGINDGVTLAKPASVRGLPDFVFGDYQGIRPSYIAFSGDAGDVVGDIRWSTWTSSHAVGRGGSLIQGCVPDCATGAQIEVPTSITLQDPVDGRFSRIYESRDGQVEAFLFTKNPARGMFPQIDREPRLSGPAVSLENYWADIDTHAYADAWTYQAAADETQAAFVQSEQEARPTVTELLATLVGMSGNRARININRLLTRDRVEGCQSWTGSYEMTKIDDGWRIESASIASRAC
jgi:hypothetical protein